MFGLHGELKLDASRIGADALRAGLAATLHLADGTERPATVAAVRRQKGRPLIRLAGIDDANAAQAVVGARLTIAPGDAALGAGEYFDADLIGCRIVDADGRDRGAVVDVVHHPNQDLLAVGAGRALVPLVAAFIAGVDVARREIRVTVPPGLLDGGAEEA